MSPDSALSRLLLVGGLMTTQTFGWGATFSQVGILSAPISEEVGLSRGQIFLGATILYIFAALSAAPAGRLADRVGGLVLLIPGFIVIGLGLWILAQADGLITFLWPWALLGAVFHIGLVTAAYTGLAQVLGRQANWAIATLTIATGLCSTIFWPLSEWMLGWTDWRGVLNIYATASIVIALPIHIVLWLAFGKLRAGQGESSAKPAEPHVRKGKEQEAQGLMVAVACVGSFLGVGFGVAVIEIFTALGTPRNEAVYAGSVIGIAYVVSRLLAVLFERWMSPAQLAQVTYAALPLSILPLLPFAFSGSPLPGWVAACVAFAFGLPAGLVGLLRSLFPLYLFGSDGYGTRLGLQARATEAASAIAPTGFTLALGLSAAGLLSGLVLSGALAFLGATRLLAFTTNNQNSDTLPQEDAINRSSRN